MKLSDSENTFEKHYLHYIAMKMNLYTECYIAAVLFIYIVF